MRVPRIELALTASMLLVGASAAVAQPMHHEDLAKVAASEIAQVTNVSGGERQCEEGFAKAPKIGGGMTWAEVTIVRALLAENAGEEPMGLVARSNGTRAPTRG